MGKVKDMPFKVWLPKFLKCVFLRKHEPVTFYSVLYKCDQSVCQICGWYLG